MGSAAPNRGIEGIAGGYCGDIDKAIYSTEMLLKPLSEDPDFRLWPFLTINPAHFY